MESGKTDKGRRASFEDWAAELGAPGGSVLAAGPVRVVSAESLLVARHWVGGLRGDVGRLASMLDELKRLEAARVSGVRRKKVR